jgi:hypothetical protein
VISARVCGITDECEKKRKTALINEVTRTAGIDIKDTLEGGDDLLQLMRVKQENPRVNEDDDIKAGDVD